MVIAEETASPERGRWVVSRETSGAKLRYSVPYVARPWMPPRDAEYAVPPHPTRGSPRRRKPGDDRRA